MTVTIGNLAGPLAAFASSPILAHALGVDGRGEVAAGMAILLLFSAVGTLGLTDASTYFVARGYASPHGILKRASLYLAAAGSALTVVNFLIAPLISGGDPELTRIIGFAGLAIVPSLLLGALRGIAQGDRRWSLINAEKYVTAVLRVIPLLVLLWLGQLTAVTAVASLVSAPLIGGVVYFGLLRGIPRNTRHDTPVPPLLRYGLSVWIGSLSGVLLARLDQALITPLAGVYALGLYVVAVNLADLLLIVQSAVGQVLFASDAHDPDDERLYRASRVSLLVTLAAALILGGLVHVWISLLFGESFLPASAAVIILLASHVIGAPGSVAGTATSARGRPAFRSGAILAAAVANAALLFVLVPPLGATGAALATLFGGALGTAMNLYFAKHLLRMSVFRLCVPQAGDLRMLWAAASALLRRRSA